MPEPFDLRLSLREKALAIYTRVNKQAPSSEVLDELRLAIDREGKAMRAPRDVKLVLNDIRFAYPTFSIGMKHCCD